MKSQERSKMFQKFTKPNPNKFAVFTSLPSLKGSIFFFGRTGAGKSCAIMSLAQSYLDSGGHKVIEICGGERHEETFHALANRDFNYWKKFERKLKLDSPGPKEYNVHILYPCFMKTLPNQLPSHPPRVKSSLFTIPFHSLSIEDMQLILGGISETSTYNFRELLEKCKLTDNAAEILFKANLLIPETALIFKSAIKPLCENHFVMSANYSKNLDVLKEIRDKQTITVLCLDYVPKEFHLFVMGWVIRQINNLLDSGRQIGHVLGLMREASDFFRATEQSVLPDRMKMFRVQLSNFIKMGRRGFHLFLDSQSPHECSGLLDISADLVLLGRMQSQGDIEDATIVAYRANLIKAEHRNMIPSLKPGEMIFLESGKMAKKRYVMLPRTMYWKPGYNFYNIWDRLNGNWQNIKDDKHIIVDEFKNGTKSLYDKLAEDKKLQILEQQIKKEEEDNIKLQEEERLMLKKLELENKVKLAKHEFAEKLKLKKEEKKGAKKEKDIQKKQAKQEKKANINTEDNIITDSNIVTEGDIPLKERPDINGAQFEQTKETKEEEIWEDIDVAW